MISSKGLFEELLPNIYIKSLDLSSKYKAKETNKKVGYYSADRSVEKVATLSDTASSDIVLSTKFIKNSKFMSDLAMLLESGLSEFFKIYAHQITDRQTYDNLLASADKNILTSDNSNLGFITTEIMTYVDANDIPSSFLQDSSIGDEPSTYLFKKQKEIFQDLPEQILEDGTILNEKITNLSFNFPKDTDFLAYIIVVGVTHEDTDKIYISKPLKEIIILDGEFQNRGMIFRIAPYEIQQAQGPVFDQTLKKLRSFGNPGDMWTGGVHRHQGRFMAGSKHTPNEPQPYLDYFIVPVTKYVDNRVQEKVERNILNITKTFETLNSLTTRYSNTANILDFEEYKSLSYTSDIDLSQDVDGNVFGTFTIDKQRILETKTAFSFLLENAKQTYGSNSRTYANFRKFMIKSMTIINLKIFSGEEIIGSLDQSSPAGKSTSFYNLDIFGVAPNTPENIKAVIQKDMFSVADGNRVPSAMHNNEASKGLQHISFKHYNKCRGSGDFTYKAEIEYIDPTVMMVKRLKKNVALAVRQVDSLINLVDNHPTKTVNGTFKSSGFNRATGKISDGLIRQIKQNTITNLGYDIKVTHNENNEKVNPGVLQDIFNMIDNNEELFLVYFYSPEVSADHVKDYIYNLSNINTTTLSQLLVLQQFLEHLNNKLASDLDSFGSKPLKTSAPVPLETQQEKGSFSRSDRKIMIKSRESRIKVHDHGYDFTGIINRENNPELEFEGRKTEGFLTITTNDLIKACLLSFSEIKSPGLNLSDAVNSNYRPYGFSSRTVKSTLYSYLNTPVSSLSSCVILPKTVSVNKSLLNPLHYLTAITKIKEYTLEDNSVSLKGSNTPGVILKEDLISILSKDGTTIPSVGQTEYTRTTKVTLTDTPKGSFNQNNDTLDVGSALGPQLLTSKALINPALDPIAAAYKPIPKFTRQTNVSNNDDISKNNLMSALMARKNFSTIVDKPFKLEMSDPGFKPYPPKKALLQGSVAVKLPLQTVCLSVNNSEDNPFKNFNQGQTSQGIPMYVKSGVINPAMLAYFWFIHQNIVKIEYLSGYVTTFNKATLKNKENPYVPGKSKISFERNIKKPRWRPLNSSVISSMQTGAKVLCRVVRYENEYYVNRKLLSEYRMPMINSQFILEKSLNTADTFQFVEDLLSISENQINPELIFAGLTATQLASQTAANIIAAGPVVNQNLTTVASSRFFGQNSPAFGQSTPALDIKNFFDSQNDPET